MEGSTPRTEPAPTGGTEGGVGPQQNLPVSLPSGDQPPPSSQTQAAAPSKQEPMELEERVIGEVVIEVQHLYLAVQLLVPSPVLYCTGAFIKNFPNTGEPQDNLYTCFFLYFQPLPEDEGAVAPPTQPTPGDAMEGLEEGADDDEEEEEGNWARDYYGEGEGGNVQDPEGGQLGEGGRDLPASAARQEERGPVGPRSATHPEVVGACTQAEMAFLGLVLPTSSNFPPPTVLIPPLAPGHPPAARGSARTPGQQEGLASTSTGGGQAKPTGLGRRPSQRRSSTISTPLPAPASHTGGAAQRAASSVDPSLSSRAQKKARGFIPWNPSAEQLNQAQLLLRGQAPYNMSGPLCLPSSDSRMKDLPITKKWRCFYCEKHFYSQLDAQGHTLAIHGNARSPPLCSCRTNVFNSAKALWDHLKLQHNIDPRGVKNNDPPVPLLAERDRPMRTPPKGSKQ